MQSHLTPVPELYVSYDSAQKLKMEAADLPSWDLTARQVCDLELLMNGGFNPLKGFMGQADYDSVVEKMRLADGTLWPMPITLDVSQAFADTIEPGQGRRAARRRGRDPRHPLDSPTSGAPTKAQEAEKVYGGRRHRASGGLLSPPKRGPGLSGRRDHRHPAADALRFSAPAATRRTSCAPISGKLGWRRVVAFQTRNPLHRAHQELTFRAAKEGAGEPADPPGRRHDQTGPTWTTSPACAATRQSWTSTRRPPRT